MNITRISLQRAVTRALVFATTLLSACGGATVSRNEDPATPSVALSASTTAVTSGASTTLTWSSENATTCTASGGWSGTKSTSGSQAISGMTASTTFTLACTGDGGSAQRSVQVDVTTPPAPPAPAAPTAQLTADAQTVASGAAATLQWSSTNATACTASGGWTGARATSGSASTGALTQPTTFELVCNGAGGASPRQSVTVGIAATPPPPPPPPTPAPTVTLSASPVSVAANGTPTLTWSSTNATACTAEGGWSGAKSTSGTQSVGPLAATTEFRLTCTGAGGSGTASTVVTVTTAGGSTIVGAVDSSLVDPNGTNRIYVFAGANVTPRDYTGAAGDPVQSVPVLQDDNACTFAYASATLAPGTYTVAFTSQAQQDRPTASDTLAFTGTATVTVGSSPVASNFAPARVLRVGPGRTYATIAAAAAAATAGSVLEVDAGTYENDVVSWNTNNVVVRGVGGRAHVRGTADIGNGKGLFVVRGTRIRVENMEFSGATVADENGAGIRGEGRDLTICNSSFHDNENGILASDAGTLTIEYSTFADNGTGDGFTHNIYVVDPTSRLVFRHNYSHHSRIGHTLKTRAAENHVLYNRIMDEASGTSSYTIDVPNGGLTYIVGNLLQQGPNTDNSTIVAYGAEGLASGRTHGLYLVHNAIVNDRPSGGAFVSAQSSTTTFVSSNNVFVGPGTLYSGKAPTTSGNVQTNAPAFVDQGGYDYRITSGSPARDAGVAVGTVGAFSLTPEFEYVHPARRQPRKTSAPPPDAGAYEY